MIGKNKLTEYMYTMQASEACDLQLVLALLNVSFFFSCLNEDCLHVSLQRMSYGRE